MQSFSSPKTTACLILMALIAVCTNAFSPHVKSDFVSFSKFKAAVSIQSPFILHAKLNDSDQVPGGDSYEGDIDWDAEWKKVVAEKGQSSDRPGKDFYKNDAQRAALKASKAASEQISKVKIVKPDINLKMLTGDAKFWIAICKCTCWF